MYFHKDLANLPPKYQLYIIRKPLKSHASFLIHHKTRAIMVLYVCSIHLKVTIALNSILTVRKFKLPFMSFCRILSTLCRQASGRFSQCPAFLSRRAKERDKKYRVKSPLRYKKYKPLYFLSRSFEISEANCKQSFFLFYSSNCPRRRDGETLRERED
jgi:hypothetical protein